MHPLKLSIITAEALCITQTFALPTGGKINNFGIKDACCLQLSPCDLTTAPSPDTYTPVCTRIHTQQNADIVSPPSCIRHSTAVLMQAGLRTLTDQEYSIHRGAHIINSSKYMNNSQLQIRLSNMSLSLYVQGLCVCVYV